MPCFAPSICPNRGSGSDALHSGSRLQRIFNAFPRWIMIVTALVASLCACSVPKTSHSVDETQTLSPRVIKVGDPVPKGGGVFKIGEPYLAGGRWWTPVNDQGYDEVGIASWYGDFFHGRRTANGEIYDMNALTAAHPTLPMPTYVTVTNLANNRTVVVRINDRGPYHDGRIIDLSHRAAEILGLYPKGSGAVRVSYLSPAPLNGDDTFERTMLAKQPWAAHVVKQKQARIASPQVVAAQASPAVNLLSAAAATADAPLVKTKGGFEKSSKEVSAGWVTNAQPINK